MTASASRYSSALRTQVEDALLDLRAEASPVTYAVASNGSRTRACSAT